MLKIIISNKSKEMIELVLDCFGFVAFLFLIYVGLSVGHMYGF